MKFLLLLSLLLGSFQQQNVATYQAQSVSFYQSGSQKFDALLSDMEAARHHIHVEYFIFANDSIGHRMIDVMARKAKQGVEVRLIIDGYYDRKRGYDYESRLDSLRALGIQLCLYSPYRAPYVNHVLRDHRKLVVIDGKVGYTGGFNVADYNIKGKPGVYGGYVDTHVRLEGAIVEGLQICFAEHFTKVGGRPFVGDAYYPYTSGQISTQPAVAEAAIIERSHASHLKKSEMRKAVALLIESATDSICIQSPYLLPTHRIRKAIRQALTRGVKVSILFSEVGDTPAFDVGNKHYAYRLVKRGAEAHLYQGAFLHSKVLTVDGQVCMVGSVNLDSRALRWNEEIAAIVSDSVSVAWLDSAFMDNRGKSIPLNREYYRNLSFLSRIYGGFVDYFLSWCL